MSKFFNQGNVSESESEEEENDSKRSAVQSEKAKKTALWRGYSQKINNSLNNNDFETLWDTLQEFLKDIEKSTAFIEKYGLPQIFIRVIIKVSDAVTNIDPETKKSFKKHIAAAFSLLKNKLNSKIIPAYKLDVEKYKSDPTKQGDDEDDDDDSSDEEFEDDSSSDEEEDEKRLLLSDDIMDRRKYWLKKTVDVEDTEEGKKEEAKRQKEKKEENKKEEAKKDDQKKEKRKVEFVIPKKATVIQIDSVNMAEKRIKELISSYTKLNHDEVRMEFLETLDKIAEKLGTYQDFEKLSFLFVEIPMRREIERQSRPTHFHRIAWSQLFKKTCEIKRIMFESEEDKLFENIIRFDESYAEKQTTTEESAYLVLKSFLIFLEIELKKAFMFIEPTDEEYLERLQDRFQLIELMYEVSNKIQLLNGLEESAAELCFKTLEHLYFMPNRMLNHFQTQLSIFTFMELFSDDKMRQYASTILKYSDQPTIIKTVLMLIYNYAINSSPKAKQLLVTSNISEEIAAADYFTQVLYNRVIVQIGILAFEEGNYQEVQHYLVELCSAGHIKDLNRNFICECLAQVPINRDFNSETVNRQRLLPHYMYFKIEHVENIELISEMIQEIPHLLTEGGRINARVFKKIYNEYERKYFIAEPINPPDLIYAASLQLRLANWKECYDNLIKIDLWQHLNQPDVARANLLATIKEQCLKCYLIGNRKCLKSVSLTGLSTKFGLTDKNVRCLLNKWIYNREIQATLNQNFVNFPRKQETEIERISDNLYRQVLDSLNESEHIIRNKESHYQQDDEIEKDQLKDMPYASSAFKDKMMTVLAKRTN